MNIGSAIKEVFKFTYYNNGFVQLKYVVSTDDYNNLIKPLLEVLANEKDKIKKERNYELISGVSNSLKLFVGDLDYNYELITDSGRFYNAVTNGFIPPAYSGDIFHNVLVEKLS